MQVGSKHEVRLGYGIGVKAMSLAPAVLGVWLIFLAARLDSGYGGWLLAAGGIIGLSPLALVAGSVLKIDRDGIVKATPWSSRVFRRDEYLSHEFVSNGPGRREGLLLRFASGVLFVDAMRHDRSAESTLEEIHRLWGSSAAPPVRPLGAARVDQQCDYEPFHASLALSSGALLAAVAWLLPALWPVTILAGFCFRTAWRALGRLSTSEEGIALFHPFQGPVAFAWGDIERVTYWQSLVQGGVRFHGAGKTIRVYRWIGGYPLLNRLVHDRLPAEKFAGGLSVPFTAGMNYRRRAGILLPYAAAAGVAVEQMGLSQPLMLAAVLGIPTLILPLLIFGSGRSLEFDREGMRDVLRFFWIRKSTRYARTDLRDARLGRQAVAGGLWLRFGDRRVEVTNSESSLPPELILAALRREWNQESGEGDGSSGGVGRAAGI